MMNHAARRSLNGDLSLYSGAAVFLSKSICFYYITERAEIQFNDRRTLPYRNSKLKSGHGCSKLKWPGLSGYFTQQRLIKQRRANRDIPTKDPRKNGHSYVKQGYSYFYTAVFYISASKL
ncbi:hypothetical protein DPQ25_00930 [Hydrogeniiclostridium mannosilyticum]|uniref:Uncharacterized protein n=1 Tax=Hydrogeniiclostridium mannosilyticum TaxID=2764322 RepID=A0A328UMF1_9FIRM|nr:hypothetical protein DPQ25_00930 [Hydrogeniiclostridium mannosilyticum]